MTDKQLTSGILIIHKPSGITSHDVVDQVRGITGIRRVGHAGTLDPLAEGLLIILIGRSATKRQAEFMAGEKEYLATIRLGATSDTDDAEGQIVANPKFETLNPKQIPISKTEIQNVLNTFVGAIEQVPPAYSAIKMKGKKAYDLAREGKQPKLKPRVVNIRKLELLAYAYPEIRLRVVCSKGTYIRALARDIGRQLEIGGYLTALSRTRSGDFTLDDAISLETLTKENWQEYLAKTDKVT